jgi:hypothetical protein
MMGFTAPLLFVDETLSTVSNERALRFSSLLLLLLHFGRRHNSICFVLVYSFLSVGSLCFFLTLQSVTEQYESTGSAQLQIEDTRSDALDSFRPRSVQSSVNSCCLIRPAFHFSLSITLLFKTTQKTR